MSSASSVRFTKRRRDEIDEKIEALSKVINNITGSKKFFLQTKLCNLKLKQQKLHAVSNCRHLSESSKQCLMTEFDMVIAENDIDIEIASIRSSKKFKRMERLFRNTVKNRSNETSRYDTEAEKENSPHISRNKSKILRPVPMSHKSTNTDPVYITEVPRAKLTVLPLHRSTSSMEDIMHNYMIQRNASTMTTFPPSEESLSSVKMTMALQEDMSLMNKNKPLGIRESQKNDNTQTPHTHDSIQSNWFENTFDIQNFTYETIEHEVLLSQSGTESCKTDSISKIPKKDHKHKTHERKTKKSHKSKSSKPSKEIVEPNSVVHSTALLKAATEVNKENTKKFVNMTSQNQSAKPHNKSVKSLPATSQDQSAKSQDQSAKAQDLTAKSQDLTAKSQDLSAKSQDLSDKCKVLSTKSHTLSTICKELSIEPQNLLVKYLSNESLNLSAKPEEVSAKCEELSAKSQDLSAKCKELFAKLKDLTKDSSTNSQNLSKLSTKANDSSKKKARKTKKDRSSKQKDQKSSSSKVSSDMPELIKEGMWQNDVQSISKEDIVNGLFKDLMASKGVQSETDNSSEKTASCHECGLVYEGHMCVYTIREILEKC